ncbi:hypothetical protein R6Q59_002041 [Mikania micrantha]
MNEIGKQFYSPPNIRPTLSWSFKNFRSITKGVDDLDKLNHRTLWTSVNVSLPGGRTDEGDTDDVHTALREAEEEIGLDPVLVDVVGVLEPFVSKGNVSVVPVMGILWDKQAFNPVLNVQEVESIFYAPFDMFLKDKNRREEERVFQEEKCLFHYFDHETNNKVYTIWAITAAILIVAASLFYQQTPDFQPRMPKSWNRNHSRL